VLLDRAGNYPIEEPGLTQLDDAIERLCTEVIA